MPNTKTLYITGAGASSEVGLPTGRELKSRIAERLDLRQIGGDRCILDALNNHLNNSENPETQVALYVKAARQIRDAMPLAESIDNFMNIRKGDEKIELCGKLAIVRSILDAEKRSRLWFDTSNSKNRLSFADVEETWYGAFIKLLTENCTKEDLMTRLKSIALVVFNYDRCIEHFLFNAFQNVYSCDHEEAGGFVQGIEIYHPYGIVGSLPWQGGQSVAFGEEEVDPLRLLGLAQQIKTFTEGTDPQSSDIVAIREHVAKASRIVFLGFAYHRENMKLLRPDGHIFDSSRPPGSCFGTAKGISSSDCEIIKREICPSYKRSMTAMELRSDLDCHRLFAEYRRGLSLD